MTQSSRHLHPEQDIEKGKFELGPAEFAVDAGSPLPEGYGDNRLVIMTRDPLWFFAYWEVTPERAEQVRQVHGREIWERAALVLRVYDLAESDRDGIEEAPFFDVEVSRDARQWYVQVSEPGHAYVADLGLRWPDGRFVSLFRSNRIKMPGGRISDQIDSQWMAVNLSEQESWNAFVKTSGEFSKSMAQRWEFLRSVFSGTVSSWAEKP